MINHSENHLNLSKSGKNIERSSLFLKQNKYFQNSNKTTNNTNDLSFQERHYIDQTTVLKQRFHKNKQKLVIKV